MRLAHSVGLRLIDHKRRESRRERTLKDMLKNSVAKVLRPGVAELNQRLIRIESKLDGTAQTSGSRFGVWRGGLKDGKAFNDLGVELPAFTAKYRDELTFWEDCIKRSAPKTMGGEFETIYGGWQHDRVKELGDFLGLGGFDGAAQWAKGKSVVEIGAGPYPSIACVEWKRAVAVDPLADGYTAEDLLPKRCHCDKVTYMACPGEAVPLPSGFADIVVLENCLDHVDEPGRVVAECRRLVNRDGLMWLLVDLMEYKDHMHPNPFSEASLKELLRREGFEPVKDRVSDHKSHPNAYGEYRGLLKKMR